MNFFSRISLTLTLCVSLVSTESSSDPSPNQYCFAACQTAFSGQNFSGSPSTADGDTAGNCANALFVQSTFLCVKAYCPSDQARSGYAYANEQCESSGYSLPSLSIVDNVTMEDIQTMQTLQYGDTPPVINSTIIPSADLFQLGLRTMVSDLSHLSSMTTRL